MQPSFPMTETAGKQGSSDITPLDNGGDLRRNLLSILFGPKLKGHFHTPFTKVLTGHFLSVHPETHVLLLVNAFLSVFVSRGPRRPSVAS